MISRRSRSLLLAGALAVGAPVAAVVVAPARPAHAYAVGPAVPIETLARSADVVCKGTVVADRAVVDPSFDRISGYEVRETELRVVSLLKGPPATRTVRYRHFAPKAGEPTMFAPPSFTFTVGRTYLLLAAHVGGDVYRPITRAPTEKDDQAVLLAADDRPHRGATITDALWGELRALAASAAEADVLTAIQQLGERSGGRTSRLRDLDRKAALAVIQPLILHRSPAVASAAVRVFAADSPYLDDAQAPYWLAGVGKGTIPGVVARKPPASPSAGAATRELLAVAGGTGATELRALALRALGRSGGLSAAGLAALARDPEVAIRAAAVLVSAELPDRQIVRAGAVDPAPAVRRAAALAVGFGQDPSVLPVLDRLLGDPAPEVRSAAAMSLLSFAPDQAAPLLTARLGTDFRPLFVNALARRDPAPHLALLAEVIEKQLQPTAWWGGRIPAADSWEILFEHVKSRAPGDLTSGRFDRSLDALERMRWFSSAEPRDLYALYVRRGMTARAKAFRAAMRKSGPFDMEPYFDMVDRSPQTYVP